MQKLCAISLLLLCSVLLSANGFQLFRQPLRNNRMTTTFRLASDSEPRVDLVPVDKTNTVNAAAVTGGILGFVLGGPLFGLVFAALSNYVAKSENESGEALRGLGKVVVESYNFLNKLNSKYSLSTKAGDTVGSLISSASSDNETLDKVKTTYSTAVEKLDEINKEYDLVTKGKEIVVAAATLSDAVIDKAIELNSKVYNVRFGFKLWLIHVYMYF